MLIHGINSLHMFSLQVGYAQWFLSLLAFLMKKVHTHKHVYIPMYACIQ